MTDWNYAQTELAMRCRVAIAGVDTAVASRRIRPDQGDEWREALTTADRQFANHERRKAEVLNSAELSPEGKQGRVAKLVEETWGRVEAPLRQVNARAVATAQALRARAERLVPDASGFLKEAPPPSPPSAEDLANDRELRTHLATLPTIEVRRLYLERVRDYGSDSITRSIERDPLGVLRTPEPWLDTRTTTAARDLRIGRAGMTDAVREADAYAGLTSGVVEAFGTALGVVKERPALIRS